MGLGTHLADLRRELWRIGDSCGRRAAHDHRWLMAQLRRGDNCGRLMPQLRRGDNCGRLMAQLRRGDNCGRLAAQLQRLRL